MILFAMTLAQYTSTDRERARYAAGVNLNPVFVSSELSSVSIRSIVLSDLHLI